jgi:hypothetical protein
MPWKYNPFTDALDQTGSGGGSYIDGEVEYHSNLPVTAGTPAVNSAFLVRKGEGLYFISRKPAGIWVRELNNGNLDDWKYAGTFSDLYRDANFRIINDTDITKELKFDASSIATGTTRTISVPNKNVTLDDAGDSRTPSSHAASHAAGIKASYKGQVAGMTSDVFIRANTAGTAGNSITLTFNGSQSVSNRLSAWNSANSSNQATLVSGDGAQVPDNGEEIALSGGVAGGSDPFKNINQDLGTTDSPNFAGATINQSGAWGLTVNSGNNETNTADFTGNSTDYNLIRVQNTTANSSFYMACTGSGYGGSNFGESNAGQVSLEVNGGGTNKVGLIGNRFGPLCLGANDKIQLRIDSNGTTISDPTDITKKVRLSASSVSAGQTRVVTFPDKNITLDDTGDTRPPASHTHELTALAATNATNGHVLTANGSGGVTFAAASGSGVTSVTGTAPIVSSGGTTPAISVTVGTGANTVAAGDDSRFHTRSHAMTGTSDHTAGNWSVFYSNGSGQVTELALGAANTVLTSNGASSAPSFAAASGGSGGATNLWIPASAWVPRTTGGCGVDSREIGATNRANVDELLFDTGTEEFAQALVVMPSNYNNSTLTARFYWTAASGSGGVAWGLSGRAYGDDAALDQSSGTRVAVTDTFITANDVHVTSATSAVTIDGTPAANKAINFQISRVVGDAADTLGVDARLLGVEIIFN